MNLFGLAVSVFFSALFSGILIWVVSLIGLGLEVDGLGPAFVAGIAITVIGGVITWVLGALKFGISSGLLRAIINTLLGAVVLLVANDLIPGLRVQGFIGAFVAAISMGVVAWVLSLLLRPINRAAERKQRGAGQAG